MKIHQVAAIVIGILILAVTFLPVILAYNHITLTHDFDSLGDYRIINVFIYPTVGVVVAGIIVFLSFFKGRDKE